MSLRVTRLGIRKTMMRMALVFIAGCVLVALAPHMAVLLAGRVVQGLGGGAFAALGNWLAWRIVAKQGGQAG